MECTPNKDALLALIRPDMKLTKEFLKRIYAFEISYPGFADQAIAALEKAGCGRAREYYNHWVTEYEDKHREEMKQVAQWYQSWYDSQHGRKGGDELRTGRQGTAQQKKQLLELKRNLLMQKLQR